MKTSHLGIVLGLAIAGGCVIFFLLNQSDVNAPPDSKAGKTTAAKPSEVEATENQLQRYYPKGKTLQSGSILAVNGNGSNENWIIRSDCFFAYEYKLLLETEIIENTGDQLEVEVFVKLASKHRINSRHDFAWRELENPQLKVLWFVANRAIAKKFPNFALVAKGVELTPKLINMIPEEYEEDVAEWVEANWGFQMKPEDEPKEIIEQFTDVNGYRVRLVLDEDINVVGDPQILERGDAKNPDKADDTILRMLEGNNILFDHVLAPAIDKPIGEIVQLDAERLSRMLALETDVSATGHVDVSRKGNQAGDVLLRVNGGQVRVKANSGDLDRAGIVTPTSGDIKFNHLGKFVSRALIAWHVEAHWFDEDHLLFGTDSMRNVSVQSLYEAQLADPNATD